tara:strand:- start:397 stop:987 length:591 start_codon:yes stop_codon:yes gene_type:complete
MEQISSGAEAIIYKKDKVAVKIRNSKSYRNKDIDTLLRKSRTKREAKVLERLHSLDISPKLHKACNKEMKIEMDHIEGDKLRDVLHKNHKKWAKEIGKKISLMHKHDIIHGDLTTSNMIVKNDLKLIDFGLSFFSAKHEDKAVDLHLLKRALESKHHEIFEEVFDMVIEEYKKEIKDHKEVLDRLKKVEVRGRNKH